MGKLYNIQAEYEILVDLNRFVLQSLDKTVLPPPSNCLTSAVAPGDCSA